MKEEKATRYYDGKPEWSLVDFDSLIPMVRVLEFGKNKYSANNWRKGLRTTQICESMLRHIFAYLNGDDNDIESKLSHIGHIQANAMFLSYMMKHKPQLDDRDGKDRQKELAEREIVRNELFDRYAEEEKAKQYNTIESLVPSVIPEVKLERCPSVINSDMPPPCEFGGSKGRYFKAVPRKKNSFDDIFKEAEMQENGFPDMGGHYVTNLKDGE